MNRSKPSPHSTVDPAGSMSVLIQDWMANENQLVERIHDEFMPRLRKLALRVLNRYPGAIAEADDVVQSAMKSLFLFMRRQSHDRDQDRDDLWRLLCHIAVRKASRRQRRQTRGLPGGRVIPMSDLENDEETGRPADLLQDVPVQDFELVLKDAIENLDESLQPIALLVMEGKTQTEIGEILGCSRRTVIRKFDLVKRLLGAVLQD